MGKLYIKSHKNGKYLLVQTVEETDCLIYPGGEIVKRMVLYYCRIYRDDPGYEMLKSKSIIEQWKPSKQEG